MDDIRAVLDAVGIDRAVVAVGGDSGPLGVLFAAAHADRTLGLVLCNVLVNFVRTHDMPWLDSREQYLADIEETTRAWAEPDMWDEMLQLTGPSLETRDDRIAFSRPIRLSVSPGNMGQHLRANADTDVRDILPSVRVPTLVICRALPERAIALTAPYVVERIPTARLARVDGNDAIPVLGDREPMQDRDPPLPSGDRGRGSRGAGPGPRHGPLHRHRRFDCEGGGARRSWLEELLDAHHGRIRRELSRFRGREVDTGRRRVLRDLRRAGSRDPLRLRSDGVRP